MKHPMPVANTKFILKSLLSATAYMHDNSIIHRDLKVQKDPN